MTTGGGRERPQIGELSIADLYAHWDECLREARERAGSDATTREILLLSASRWAHEMPPELAFVSDEIHDLANAMGPETAERIIERVVRGELAALRRIEDGSVLYLRPEEARTLMAVDPGRYQHYDPLLARALREHALEEELQRLDQQQEQ